MSMTLTKAEVASLPEAAFKSRRDLGLAVQRRWSVGLSKETLNRILEDKKNGSLRREADEISDEDLAAASGFLSSLLAGDIQARNDAAVAAMIADYEAAEDALYGNC